MIVKVCGMREPDNISALYRLPVDWMGLIFYPRSDRYAGAREDLPAWLEREKSPEGLSRVGVFVNADPAEVAHIVSAYGLRGIQLHGDEKPEWLKDWARWHAEYNLADVKVIKALRIGESIDRSDVAAWDGLVDYLLFDTRTKSYGGSGRSFDWGVLSQYEGDSPFLLSGGIGPESLEALQDFDHPRWTGIDLNSRFESTPGIKDIELLDQFLNQFEKTHVQ